MKKGLILVAVLAAAGVLYTLTGGTAPSAVLATNARAQAMGVDDTRFMVTLDLQNDGEPVTLTGVSSPSGAEVSLMSDTGAPLVIPGGGQAQLAMDGAHVMMRTAPGSLPEGGFQPLSLSFDDGSTLTARVMRPAATGAPMAHGTAAGVAEAPAPQITLTPPETLSPEGFTLGVAVSDFTFTRVPDGSAHVPGEGHAHLYLNGLKLGRLYGDTVTLGALLPGDYTLKISLNTHDHRAYLSDGAPVTATYRFTLP